MNIRDLIKQQAQGLQIDYHINSEKTDGFTIVPDGPRWKIVANNPRSCLWAVYHLADGGAAGTFAPRFEIRGINTCETISRHSSDQLCTLIDRMAHWRMNTLVAHLAYGFDLHGDLIESLCRQRGIDIKYYVQTSLKFLNPDIDTKCFARDRNGRLHAPSLENTTRLCVCEPTALEAFRTGAREFFADDHIKPNTTFVLMDADGYGFCQCTRCRNIKPVEQWNTLFRIAMNEVARSEKNLSIDYLCYVWRYALPEQFKVFNNVSAIMFDTHQRFRWAALNEKHQVTPLSALEGKGDPRAEKTPLNVYLYDRLVEWRKAFSGQIYIFENLMIQGSLSCPQPYTPELLEDLNLYEQLGVQGVVYEAFEPGIQSFEKQISILCQAMWDSSLTYQPRPLDIHCRELRTSGVTNYDYKNLFNVVLDYLQTESFDALDLLRQDNWDTPLIEYMAQLRIFLAERTVQNYRAVMDVILQHKNRFDGIFIGVYLARAIPRELHPWINQGDLGKLLYGDKVWDITEKMSDPLAQTWALVESLALAENP